MMERGIRIIKPTVEQVMNGMGRVACEAIDQYESRIEMLERAVCHLSGSSKMLRVTDKQGLEDEEPTQGRVRCEVVHL